MLLIVTSLLAGGLFGLGLIVSGMADPAKVLGFLDLAGAWDPSLALVMAGAVGVGLVVFFVAGQRRRSLLGAEMRPPTARQIDRRLVGGGLLFGIGWVWRVFALGRRWSRSGSENSRRWCSSWPCWPVWRCSTESPAAGRVRDDRRHGAVLRARLGEADTVVGAQSTASFTVDRHVATVGEESRMKSQGENLVKMANQIGVYFASQHQDDADAAAQAVAAHLKMFWAPPMRQDLIDLQQQPGGAEMLPVVQKALRDHAVALTRADARVGGQSSEVFPAGGGDAG